MNGPARGLGPGVGGPLLPLVGGIRGDMGTFDIFLLSCIDCDVENDGLEGGGPFPLRAGADEDEANALDNAARGDIGDIGGSGIRDEMGGRWFWLDCAASGDGDTGDLADGELGDLVGPCASLLPDPDEMNEGLAVLEEEMEFIVSLELADACLAK